MMPFRYAEYIKYYLYVNIYILVGTDYGLLFLEFF